jgi:hypothetical protein
VTLINPDETALCTEWLPEATRGYPEQQARRRERDFPMSASIYS